MIAVIGATGNVGRALVDQLCDAGERPRIVSRDGGKASRWGNRVETVVGDVRDTTTRERVLAGVEKLFSLSFIEAPAEVDAAITTAARNAGVRHIVKLSSIGAPSAIPIGRRHGECEEFVRASGVAWTFLRPGYFMANTLRWVPMIKAEGRVVTPAPDAKVQPISEKDVAEVARLCLLQSAHEGKIYELIGAEHISAREQVGILSRVLGKPIQCHEADTESTLEHLRALGQPAWLIESFRAMWANLGAGGGNPRLSILQELTGRAPQSFEAWCQAHCSAFA